MKLGIVDPRAWNIVAGLCVASGCGSRLIGADDSSDGTADGSGTDASESSDSNTTTDTQESGGPECVTSDDCPLGYYCYGGVCQYFQPPDGHLDYTDDYWVPECYTDSDCSGIQICNESSYCDPVSSPAACPAPDPVPGLSIPVAALALHFVDVDADGADELVVATASELQVYESGSNMPVISPRGLDSDTIDSMAGAEFDGMPGDDVMILFADELRLHASDGVGNFAAPSVTPSSLPDSAGLLDGEFDAVAPADLLIWASSGAGVELGSGDAFPLTGDVVHSATARSFADPLGGFVLQHDKILDFYTVAGEPIAMAEMRGGSPFALTSIVELGDSFDLSASVMNPRQWTIIEQWGPGTGYAGNNWGLLGQVTAMAGGDFDGDARADIAIIMDGTLQIQFTVLNNTSCLALYPFAAIAQSLAIGDHDGDGDDEIAIRFEAGNVAVIDGE